MTIETYNFWKRRGENSFSSLWQLKPATSENKDHKTSLHDDWNLGLHLLKTNSRKHLLCVTIETCNFWKQRGEKLLCVTIETYNFWKRGRENSYSMWKWKSTVRENENCMRRPFLKRRCRPKADWAGLTKPSLRHYVCSQMRSDSKMLSRLQHTREGFESCKWPKAERRAGPQFAGDIRLKVKLAWTFDIV